MVSTLAQIWHKANRNVRIASTVAFLFILWMLSGLMSCSEESMPTKETPLKSVTVIESLAVPFETTLTITGRTKAEHIITIAAQTEGQISKTLVEQGDFVKPDTPLLHIDPTTRTAQIAAAKAHVEETRTLYNAAQKLNKQGYTAKTELAARKTALADARLALALAEEDLKNTRPTSPIAAYVEEKAVSTGDYVKMGEKLYTLIDREKILLTGAISQKDRPHVKIGREISATLLNGTALTGTIRFVGLNAHMLTKTYDIEATVENPPLDTPLGMTADITIPTGTVEAHRIPHAALVLNSEGNLGVRYVEKNVVKFAPVTPLQDTLDGLWITGLPPKAHIIIRGQSGVFEGERVEASVQQASR